MTTVHLVVPTGIDDARRPSGGNTYDRRVRDGLTALGWTVHTHRIEQPQLDAVLARLPEYAVVVIDGLIASAAPDSLRRNSSRLRSIGLVHLPSGVADVGGEAARRERAALSSMTAIIATSPWTRRWLLDEYGLDADVLVIEPGADRAPVSRASASGGRLLCVGALAAHKGQDVLVKALAEVEDLDWDCRLVGATVDAAFARALTLDVDARGLAPRIRLTGPMADVELDAAYRSADVLLVPSRMETYGIVVLEALARGVPTIATTAGGLPHVVGVDHRGAVPGLLVPPDDPSALADGLRAWLTDDVLRRRLRTSAFSRRSGLRAWHQTVEHVARVVTAVAA